jgi:hypothetical protein
MSPYVLDVLLWIVGIRGHIPHYEEFRPGRSEPSPTNAGRLFRILAAVVLSVMLLSLALWAAVWLAIRLV